MKTIEKNIHAVESTLGVLRSNWLTSEPHIKETWIRCSIAWLNELLAVVEAESNGLKIYSAPALKPCGASRKNLTEGQL